MTGELHKYRWQTHMVMRRHHVCYIDNPRAGTIARWWKP